MNPSYCLSVLVPTINESNSLRETVETLIGDQGLNSDILEIILVTCDETLESTLKTCQELEAAHEARIYRVTQRLPRLGGAFRSGMATARGTHIVTMFADLESDPRLVPTLVSESKAFPGAVISASRWIKGGGFEDYGSFKLVLNYLFQRICGFGCRAKVSDYTYGFRIYPSRVLKTIPWRETDHAFVVESILRPYFHGVPIREVAAVWSPRKEGIRRFRFWQYIRYVPTVCRVIGQHRLIRSPNSPCRKASEAAIVEPAHLNSPRKEAKAESLPVER
jgi:glycosyltransferase involved in cell wall biosynthesis